MFYRIIRQTLLYSVIGLLYLNTAHAEGTASPSMLSNTCLGCHGPSGISDGPATPTISGMSEIYIIGAMLAYKFGDDEDKAEEAIEADPDLEDVEYFPRVSTVMNRIAQGYSVEEIKIIAKHFAEMPFQEAKQDTDSGQAKTGEKRHDKYCEKCHEDGGRSAEDDAGVLAGQWMPYLVYTMADFADGDRAMPKKMKKKMEEMHEAHKDEATAELIQFYGSQN